METLAFKSKILVVELNDLCVNYGSKINSYQGHFILPLACPVQAYHLIIQYLNICWKTIPLAMWSSDWWSLVTRLNCHYTEMYLVGTSARTVVVFQDRWSLTAVFCSDRYHCTG